MKKASRACDVRQSGRGITRRLHVRERQQSGGQRQSDSAVWGAEERQ